MYNIDLINLITRTNYIFPIPIFVPIYPINIYYIPYNTILQEHPSSQAQAAVSSSESYP